MPRKPVFRFAREGDGTVYASDPDAEMDMRPPDRLPRYEYRDSDALSRDDDDWTLSDDESDAIDDEDVIEEEEDDDLEPVSDDDTW